MGRNSRLRQQRKQAARAPQSVGPAPAPPPPPQSPVARASLWLAAAFLLPNLGALACRFAFDDRVLIVESEPLHSLRHLAVIWTSGYWPDPRGQELYRPVVKTLWALEWAIGGGSHPAIYHAVGLALGLAVVLVLYRFLLEVATPPRTAFIAALLFALLPIHTEATTSVVGSAETLAAAFALAALILYYRGRIAWPLVLFALAVFSKESAATFAALPVVFPRGDAPRRTQFTAAAGAAAIVAAALAAHFAVSRGPGTIPAIDNPASLVSPVQRILTALWVQCLYISKSVVPLTLSADYSYKQVPLVMGLDDWRAWAGLTLAAGFVLLALDRRYRAPALVYGILFCATDNLLFPIGTIMGERLVYAPSIGLALLAAIWLARSRYWTHVLVALALLFGARTAVRNLDWLDARHFYLKLVETAPGSAKSWYSLGVLRASEGDDAGAVEAYDRAIAIFPAYSEAFHNRGNSLVRLGRRAEAMESYRQCLRFDPGHAGAAYNLMQLEAGRPLNPPRKPL
ncbi:MAG TPA: tetratricopeptide repeat protein [Candidatus Acidoferrales bacterium]|nr:tetratricopeptide repeat protein [Candidatus Acidoferrales bacterium]